MPRKYAIASLAIRGCGAMDKYYTGLVFRPTFLCKEEGYLPLKGETALWSCDPAEALCFEMREVMSEHAKSLRPPGTYNHPPCVVEIETQIIVRS